MSHANAVTPPALRILTPSSPTSSTSTTSANRRSKPTVPTNHKFTYLNGRCGQKNGCTGLLIGPIFTSKHNDFFVKCALYDTQGCNFFRFLQYNKPDTPTHRSSTSAFASQPQPQYPPSTLAAPALPPSQPPSISQPPSNASYLTPPGPVVKPKCALGADCTSKGNGQRVNEQCRNRMCLQDCARASTPCPVYNHKQARLKNGGISSSQPVPSASHSAQPRYATQPAPSMLSALTISSVLPTAQEPHPRPAASPHQDGATFLRVKHFAQDVPTAWEAEIKRQQRMTAERLIFAAEFRKDTKEGITVYVGFWNKTGVPPELFERIIHVGHQYSISHDIDLCGEVGFDPSQAFISVYQNGLWLKRSPRELIQVTANASRLPSPMPPSFLRPITKFTTFGAHFREP